VYLRVASSVLVHDHAADVAAGEQVCNGVVDGLERIALGDPLVELQPSGAIEIYLTQDVGGRSAHAEQAALDALLEGGQHEQAGARAYIVKNEFDQVHFLQTIQQLVRC